MVAVEVVDLRKSYGAVEAVRGISLSVAEGEVFALLGPNGAGKTTTVEILEGFRRRDSGDVSVLGFDPAHGDRKLKEQLGIVLQTSGVDPYLTVAETVDMFRGYYPKPRPRDEVLELVGLTEKADSRVTKLSGGQQRRLDVAIALAGDPRLLFLDEPTTGFDPSARRNAWEVIKGLAGLGKTIFLTSHSMDEVQYLADRVVIIAAGKVVAEGTPDTLAGREKAAAIVRFQMPENAVLPGGLGLVARIDDGIVRLETGDPTRTLYELTSWAVQSDIELGGLEVTRPSLEDVYLEITKNVAGSETKE
ncbi:MAG: ABC transporter ATP-binding protein [Chloroflexi bacterium]|nr:MAG: ABC transporter ATP-binding protein [Chloroflexota bacterium]TME56299.1 MAG: ABC transporter ATP-binding protein [Chloroflexota bacterium]